MAPLRRVFAAASNRDGILPLYARGCGPLTEHVIFLSFRFRPRSTAGLVEGANQINLMIPAHIASGPNQHLLTAGKASSEPFAFTLPGDSEPITADQAR